MGNTVEVARRFYDQFNSGKGTADCFAADSVIVSPLGTQTRDEHSALESAFRHALPDLCFSVTRMVASGNEVYASGVFTATHSGDLVTPDAVIAASGNTIQFAFVDYFEIDGDQIKRHESMFEVANLMAQLTAAS
jgi:predicted ester cyclase